MYQKLIFILFILNGDLICAASVADSWILFAKALKDSWIRCPVEHGVVQCFKRSSLEVFDKMIKADVIPLAENVRLQRNRDNRKMLFDGDSKMDTNMFERSSMSAESWSKCILKSIFNLRKTHTLSIGKTSNEGLASESTIKTWHKRSQNPISARRRRQNNMLPMMLLGLTAFGVFTVPMGFQFILILCGKAVLLSKMALLLSSINGSRRVEHSDAQYGLYRPGIHNHGVYWSRDDEEQPRSREM